MKILVFCCDWCSYPGADLAGILRLEYPPEVRIIKVMCSGRVDPMLVLDALRQGIDGVMVTGCHPGECHYVHGNMEAERRIELLRSIFERSGINPRRVRIEWISASEGEKFAEVTRAFKQEIDEIGPINQGEIDAAEIIHDVFSSERARLVLGASRRAIELEGVDPLWYKGVLERTVREEVLRERILRELRKSGALSAHELAERIGEPAKEIFWNLIAMKRRQIILDMGIVDDSLKFAIQEGV
ncbi:MAG: methyl-viologen-reducing hydrogenase delta subunit [Candidatus Syntrophoarchaeum caldarius]|uniref:Methyl-viologen-reducing hydrogenase delta subunit n=1 Tax=Candidatus Syntropharchaeum caldarium TaxID=1838285 RepID=A0A1F2PC73_9EURY|nr:MAG: methyl-viologen-reducing hydrogenase delta subunit [Candidatus Syntrophoarchaeum caldarius]